MAKATKLNVRQQRFVDGIIAGKNATQAYLAAGYETSPLTARVSASDLLANPVIAAEVDRRRAKVVNRLEISQERVLNELARIAFADTTRAVYVENGSVRVRDTDELTDDERAAIAEISETHSEMGGSLKVKLHSKTHALDLLGKHLRLFGADQAPTQTNVFVLVAPGQAPTAEKWAELVEQQAALPPPEQA